MAEVPERRALIDYLPPFMQTFKEFKEITGAEQVDMEQANLDIGRIIDEAFIEDCDEYGIKKYESIIGILPEDTDTLADRKARVLIRWNDTLPYSYRALIQRLNSCCGVNNYDITADLENYEISVYTHLTLTTSIEEVEKTIDHMLPMNMHYETFNDLIVDISSDMYNGAAIVTSITSIINMAE